MTDAAHALVVEITKNTITTLLKMAFPWIKYMENSGALISMGSIVWSIVILATIPM